MNDSNYSLALSILNDLVGLRFVELQRAQANAHGDSVEIGRLKTAFEFSFQQRDDLRTADEQALQAIIDTFGPEVRRGVEAMRTQAA